MDFATRDPRSGRYFAAMTSPFYGPKLFVTDDPASEWEQAEGLELPEDGETTLERIWTVVPGEEDGLLYLGAAPGVLFESRDGGIELGAERGHVGPADEARVDAREPAGCACNSIATWPGDPDRLAIGISAVGMWLSDDAGTTWRHGNTGLVPRYVPEESREDTLSLCVHNVHRAPKRPDRLFMQFHGGVYRSEDAGESWIDIGTDSGLPSDFGFPLVVDPEDPDSAYVIPLTADLDRVTPEGRVRVYETRDAGETWAPRGDGLPASDAYLTILRQAFGRDGGGPSMGLYFGATSGEVFGSGDAGATWFTVAEHLPPVHSVRAA